MAVRSLLPSRYFLKKKKKSCTFNLSLQGRGDILTTHKRVIAYQKKVMLWKEHLEECMFGSIFHCYVLLLPKWCLFLTKIFIFVHSKTWKENVLLLKNSPKGKFLWNLETLLRLWECNTFHLWEKQDNLWDYWKCLSRLGSEQGKKRKSPPVFYSKPLLMQ